tara:strand:- start:97 stop:717 length:621 start_codon:yes stop_codon:yes gene_type:complete
MKVFKNGLLTGLVLQMAIGPVFFFIVNIALQKTLYDGFAAVSAVTIVDYFYITLAILGVGKLLEKKKVKKIFGIISSIVLITIGIIILANIPTEIKTLEVSANSNLLTSFTSVFFLTISNPMTIVFFTGVFSAKAIEYNYTKHQLWIFGLSVGLATLLFMGSSVILFSLLKKTVPILLIQTLNIIIGCLIIIYGAIRFKPVLKNSA